jgi:hypothetical protein
VKEGLFFDGIALRSGGVSPGDIKCPTSVVANFADSRLVFGNGTAMSASKTAHPVVIELLIKMRSGFANPLVQNTAESAHGNLSFYSNAAEQNRPGTSLA